MITRYSMIETLRDFVDKANQLGLEYMVTGSFAMSAFGEIRFTRDIDIVVELSQEQVERFVDKFKDNYYVGDASVRRAVSRRSMFNIVSHDFGGKIDCIVSKDSEFAQASFRRRRKTTLTGVEFWTTTKEDLIVAKLEWARESRSEMQIRDIANLISNEYDSEYVSDWVAKLKLEEIWSEVEKWKTQHHKTDN